MDQMKSITRAVRIREWQQRIIECKSSGMNVYQWCKQNNVSKDAYYYWLKICREAALDSLPADIKSQLPAVEASPKLTKLQVQSLAPSMHAAVIVRLPHATIEVSNGANQSTVEAVLLALKSTC